MDDVVGASHADERLARSGDDLKADYAAWRDRLRKKAERNRAAGPDAEARAQQAAGGTGGYWDPEALFRDSDRVAGEEASHLAVLDLRDDATSTQILAAYRNLAKMHHPDRWVDADPEIRMYHENCMRNLNDAYHALKTQQRV